MAESSATFAVSASLEHARESFGTYQRAQERAGAVRVWFDVEGQGRIGHIGTVTKTDPQRGMRVQLVTTDVAAAHWLPPTGQGAIWDWLTDGVRLVVSYLEDESDPGSLTDYEGLIVNYDLERLMLHVAFNNGGGDGEWVSLVEDEWHWCGPRNFGAQFSAPNSPRAILGAQFSAQF